MVEHIKIRFTDAEKRGPLRYISSGHWELEYRFLFGFLFDDSDLGHVRSLSIDFNSLSEGLSVLVYFLVLSLLYQLLNPLLTLLK